MSTLNESQELRHRSDLISALTELDLDNASPQEIRGLARAQLRRRYADQKTSELEALAELKGVA